MNVSIEEDRETTSDSDVGDADEDKPAEFAGQEDLSTFVNVLFSYLVEGTQVHSGLPTGEDYQYQETFRAFPREMAQYASILLQLIEGTSKLTMKNPVDLSKAPDCETKMDAVVEIIDSLLENVDGTLDELKGKKDQASAAARRYTSMRRISGVLRPQVKFNPPPDNSPAPFRVKIFKDSKLTYGEPGVHYYEEQVRAFKPTPAQLQIKQEQLYRSLEDTPCHWVDTLPKLQEMERKLSSSLEVAVDIEAHSYRSFQGFVCLLQFSTRAEDFLVDALELRDHLHCLHSFFTNPAITKVMHGAHYDVEWLQRDFGIYVVNLFDTSCAAKVLDYPSLGLAHLLKYFCEVAADKRFQTADWRIRPLPSEMLKYAREDTHYLLYVHDRLKVLLEQTPGKSFGLTGLEECYELSREICLRRYEKETLDEMAFQKYVFKNAPGLTRQQEEVLRVVMQWRDTVARAEDESKGYVLPSAMLLHIAHELPTTAPKLFACCNPVPALLRRDARTVLDLIQRAAQNPATPARPPPPAAAAAAASSSPCPSPVPCDGFAPPTSPDGNHLQPPPNLTTPSPVLNTDQLYQVAGWVEQPGGDVTAPPSAPRADPKPKATATVAIRASDDLRTQGTAGQDRGQYVPKASVSQAEEGGSVLYSALASATSTPQPKFDFSKLFANVSGGNAAARVNASFFSNSPSPPSDTLASRLFQESPAGPAAMETDATATPPQADPRPKEKEKETPPEERVPRSLHEIYHLSKQNRKRNKDKKRLKEDNVPDPSPAFAPTNTTQEDGDEMDTEEPAGRPMKDAVEFMRDIGWVTDPDAVAQWMDAHGPEGGAGGAGSGKAEPRANPPSAAPAPRAPQPQRPAAAAPAGRPQPTAPRSAKKPFQHTAGSGFVPYDYGQAPGPFGARK